MSTEKSVNKTTVEAEASEVLAEGVNSQNKDEKANSSKNENGLADCKEAASASGPEPQKDLNTLSTEAFDKLVNYVQEDLSSVVEDYKLLEQMNRVAISKYAEMKQVSTGVHIEMVKINDKYRSLIPCLEQIDQIEDNVSALEEVAHRLDAYSKRLEAKFKELEKR